MPKYPLLLKTLILCSGMFFVRRNLNAQQKPASPNQLVSSSKADTWIAMDDLGRTTSIDNKGGEILKDKFVGMFYFTWQGSHGYDTPRSQPDQGVLNKLSTDTLSPYDLSKLIEANPESPKYGPIGAFHYWSEPYFGYYLPDDEWIIRKHAQMLSDAGVDVIILDVTNGFTYLPIVKKIGDTYRKLRAEGISTPYIAFIVNSAPKKTVDKLFTEFYQKGLYKDLWFTWKGKALLLAPSEELSDQEKAFFTLRQSWAWTKNQKWFGNGKDKWPWLDHTPQNFGWHESPAKAEEISVTTAEHPISNIGRSFHNGEEPAKKTPSKGLYFQEQWKRALEVNPEFVFVTGWNEWVAQRFDDGKAKDMMGKSIKKGETYFVDQYSPEYSRDIEPMKGGFNDNYYYQLIEEVRKFKGSRMVTRFSDFTSIKIDGDFKDWKDVKSIFYDDLGDTYHRNHPGFGRIKSYINNSGRNDIIETKIATDRNNIFFYVKTAEAITKPSDINWMNLLLSIAPKNKESWQGFNFVLNRNIKNHQTSIEKLDASANPKEHKWVGLRQKGNEMEISIPKKDLGISNPNFVIDFKWTDNIPLGDPMKWLDTGDAAPNARFKYRYIFNAGHNNPKK